MSINFLTIASILFVSCHDLSIKPKPPKSDTSIIALRIEDSLSVVNPADGKVWYLHDSCRVYFHKDLVMYQTYYRFTESVQGEVISETYRPRYFVFQRDSIHGTEYDSVSKYYHKRRTTKDSVLMLLPFTQLTPFYQMFQNKDSFTLVSAAENKRLGTLIERYASVNVWSITDFDTAYLYFDKRMNHIPFFFMNQFDSLKGAKLHRIRYVYNATYSKENGGNIDKREWYFDMKEENNFPNRSDVIKYFRQYETEVLKRRPTL